LRTSLYTAFTSRLNSNVLAIDYRGFGDSEGYPTEDGVTRDARAGWDYLISQGAQPEDITIVGHSLGTAIASLLAAGLGRENITPRGLALLSVRVQPNSNLAPPDTQYTPQPFSSVRTLVDEYYLFGILPLLKPLKAIPYMSGLS